jgi:hypothetical protein
MFRYLMIAFGLLLMFNGNQEGAIKVKSIEASTTKWSENAARAASEMATNAEAAAEDWARNTVAATDNYHMAITAPGIKERFRRGVSKAGAAKFARKIRDVARDRFGPGVAAAVEDYKAGAEPYFSALASITLSPRKPRGDPANYKRVEEIGKALNAKRLAMLGGGG